MNDDQSSSSSLDLATSDNKEPVLKTDDVLVIWYDAIIDSITDRKLFNDELNACINYFTDHQSCLDYVQSMQKSTIFFITSVYCARNIIPSIHKLRQIDSIFITSVSDETIEDLLRNYSKIIGFFHDNKILTDAVQENIELAQKQKLTFSFYNQHQKSTRDLSKESALFLWFQLFKDVILNMSSDDLHAKQDMIVLLRQRYHNNNKQLKFIAEFEEKYHCNEAIRWYTGQPFLYKNLNNALRTEDIEQLYIFRFFISDLCKSLLREFQVIKDWEPVLTLYRGTRILISEYEKLKQNVGQLMSMNGFLSTSLSKEVATTFAGQSSDTKQSILIEIECDFRKVETTILAQVTEFSTNPYEQEVLIDIGAVFEILSVGQIDSETNLLLVKMKATDEGAKIANEYIQINREELKVQTVSIIWGDLLMKMGHYDRALQYFIKLQASDKTIEDWKLQLHIGHVLREKGELDEALSRYMYANELIKNQKEKQPAQWLCISILYDIGIVQRLKGFYDQALNYFFQFLEFFETESTVESDTIRKQDLAACLSSIGNCYYNMGEYNQAMTFYTHALHEKENYYSYNHVDIAKDLNHLGIICKRQGEYEHSMKYFSKALEIFEKSLPSEHHDIATTLMNIADVHDEQGEKKEALHYLMQALNIQRKAFPNGHLEMALCLNNIAAIYATTGELEKSLEHSQLSLDLKRIYLRSDHHDIAIGLANHGNILKQQDKNDEAFEYYMKALPIYEKNFPDGHPDSANLMYNIGSIYHAKGEYENALNYYEKARTIQARHFPSGHPNLALTLSCVAQVYQSKSELSIASECYKECINILEKYSTSNDPMMTNTWMALASILMMQGNLIEAMGYYMKAFLIENDQIEHAASEISYNLQLIALVSDARGQTEMARDYCEKALVILQKYDSDNRISIIQCLLNISEVCEKLTKYDDALSSALQALEIQFLMNPNSSSAIITNQNNIGFLYTLKKDYTTALTYYLKSVEGYEKLLTDKNHQALAATFDNIACCYENLRNYNLAIQYYGKSLAIYKTIMDKIGISVEELQNLKKTIDDIDAHCTELLLK
ncbi:unnamed protein product [Rotaria sp. Silwood2]|nr:unnamed protein product [Rotaria sp. Silwood2]CAF4487588.1 unnamed protein product [Rotaria sp. Silwood2]